jgi:preprotein translocase subunit SecY
LKNQKRKQRKKKRRKERKIEMKFGFDVGKVTKYIPSVEKPTYKQTFNTRLKWTGVALLMFFVLSAIKVFGIDQTANFEQFRFFEIVLGSKFGSLMTLGIGPIVTAGIVLQLLVGSKIIDWDTTKPEEREKFQMWNKFIAVMLCFLEAAAFVLAGALPVTGELGIKSFVILQLAAGAMIVILLDELVSKWGFGSGISLFIAAGVGSQILIRVLSPFSVACVPGNILTCLPNVANPPTGILWRFVIEIFANNSYQALITILPLLSTAAVFVLVVYMQNVRIEIPLAFSALRGFGRSWALKLLYTSNMPVILTAALVANMQLIAHVGAVPNEAGLVCGWLGCFDQQNAPINGVVYYLTAPRDLLGNIVSMTVSSSELLRALTYTTFMAVFAMIFSLFWVGTSGMDAASVADQIEGIGMQIPGYRRDKRVMESVLNRYIPALTIVGGLLVGMLAAFADFTGALGTGTGMLLTVMIVYNYYEELSSQRLEEAHPFVRKLFGE